MTQPSADDWAAWLQTWRCSTPEMAAELTGRVAAVVEGETGRLRAENARLRDALTTDEQDDFARYIAQVGMRRQGINEAARNAERLRKAYFDAVTAEEKEPHDEGPA